MKAFIVPLCLCFLWMNTRAQKFGSNWERGFSDQYRAENTLGQYAFGYNEDHTSGGSFRRETGDRYGNKMGSYGLRISDGRIRIVNYVADHNGYRADVMTNEPGMSNQKSNGYVEVTKKGFRGIMIPGFRNSAEAPHVTFSDSEEHRTDLMHGGMKEQQANFHQESMKDQQANFHQENMKDQLASSNRGDINEQYTAFNHGSINGKQGIFNRGIIDDSKASYNQDNMDDSPANFHNDDINKQRGTFNYDDINEQHENLNQGANEEYEAKFNRGNVDNQQLALGNAQGGFANGNTDGAVGVPQMNGVTWEDSNQEFHSGLGEENFYAPNVVFDVMGAESKVVKGVKKNSEDGKISSVAEHEQSSTVESTERPIEPRVTESVKVSLGVSGNATNTEKS